MQAFVITALAGLATSIGGVLGIHRRVLHGSVLAFALAFAVGAMVLVSFVELLPVGFESLVESGWASAAIWLTGGTFVLGLFAVASLDRFLPSPPSPTEVEAGELDALSHQTHASRKLFRSGALVALVLALHNFPEGMSTFFAASQDLSSGLVLAIAIAIHNIPEGIAVAAPIYAATGDRRKAFWWATFSGVAEPIGALIGFGIISMFVPTTYIGLLYGFVAGMMTYVALTELLPAARNYAPKLWHIGSGALAGMSVMVVSILLVM